MLSYIILLSIIGILILAVRRASKGMESQNRPHREPRVGLEELQPALETAAPVQVEPELMEQAETVIARELVLDTEEVLGDADVEVEPTMAKPDIIVMSVIADPSRLYRGYELLQTLLTGGLRYGKHGIFHRYEKVTGHGNVLFSLASAMEPGTFDLSKMGSFSTRGLTLFFQVGLVKNPSEVFEMMLNTANELIEDLGGEIVDEQRVPLSQDKIKQWRAALNS